MIKSFNISQTFLICLFLIITTLVVYWQVVNSGFIRFDDPGYVTQNYYVQKGLTFDGFLWAFTSVNNYNWHPLTTLSHMLDVQMFGLKPAGHHLINLLLHIINTLLLFIIFQSMTGALWQSAFVAAAFALHPIHVESVAWVSERKDVLSTFFFLLTMYYYFRYTEHPETARYLPVVLFFALGLMAKQMIVTLPFVFLLMDYWPLGRMSVQKAFADNRVGEQKSRKQTGKKRKISKPTARDSIQTQKKITSVPVWPVIFQLVKEKLPLFVLSAAASIVVFLVQTHTEIVKSIAEYPLLDRMENAVVSYVLYIGKMFWPAGLSIFYPHPQNTLAVWQVMGAGLLLVSITISILVIKKPYLTIGCSGILECWFPSSA